MKVRLRRVGNSLTLTVPSEVRALARWKEGDTIDLNYTTRGEGPRVIATRVARASKEDRNDEE